jgi:hypothetical protein
VPGFVEPRTRSRPNSRRFFVVVQALSIAWRIGIGKFPGDARSAHESSALLQFERCLCSLGSLSLKRVSTQDDAATS